MDGSDSIEMHSEGKDARSQEEIGSPHLNGIDFNLLIKNADDGILLLNSDATIRYFSPAVKRLSGYEDGELLNKNAFDLIHPDEMQEIMRLYTEGIRVPGHVEQVECRLRKKDGSWSVIQATGMNMLHDPVVAGVIINMRDISEFRRMEHELRASEERYRYLVENLSAVVFTLDSQGVITYGSPALERWSGYKVQELVGFVFTNFVYGDDLPGLMASFERVIAGHTETYEFRVADKDGTLRYMQTSSRPIVEDGATLGLLGTLIEITGRVEADEAKRRNEEHFKEVIRRQIRYYRSGE